MIRFTALCVTLLLLFLTPSHAAEITVSTSEIDGSPIISISGEIIEGDQDKFRNFVRKAPEALVFLDSPGGLIEPAIEIGKIIYYNEMTTVVEDTDCASACGLIWLAGQRRVISTNGRVGFHAVYFSQSKLQQTVSSSGNALVGAYLRELKFNAKIIEYATEASPKSMKWLTESDAQQINLETLFLDRRHKALDAHEAAINSVTKSGGEITPEVLENYTLAARHGFAGSQNNLGDLYETGNGVVKSLPAAVYWYTRAAERGEPTAYVSLGSILADSDDVNVLIEALKFSVLAQNTLPEGVNKSAAIALIKNISDRMPTSARLVSLQLVKEWTPLFQETALLADDPTPQSN